MKAAMAEGKKHFYYYVESATGALEKTCMPQMSPEMAHHGLAMSLPLNREGRRGEPMSRTETLSIPLTDYAVKDVEGLARQYRALAGQGPDSLIGFVLKVNMAGFSIFENATAAIAFQSQRAHAPTVRLIEERLNALGAKTDFNACATFLARTPRGANRAWEKELLEKHVRGIFGKEDTEFSSRVVATLQAEASDWDNATSDVLADVLATVLKIDKDTLLTAAGKNNAEEVKADSEALKLASTRSIAWVGDGGNLSQDPTWLIHCAVALAANRITQRDTSAKIKGDVIAAELLAGAQYNGISWLLGKGLELFAQYPDDLMRILAVPAGAKDAIRALHEQAAEILNVATGDWGKPSEYRTHVGGAIASFVAVYVDRLNALSEYMACVVNALSEAPNEKWFAQDELTQSLFNALPIEQETLKGQWAEIHAIAQNAQQIISAALGNGNVPSAQDFDALELGIDRIREFGSVLRQLKNNIKQMHYVAENSKDDQAKRAMIRTAEACAFSEELAMALDGKLASSDEGDGGAQIGEKGAFNPPLLNRFGREREPVSDVLTRNKSALEKSIMWLEGYAKDINPNQNFLDAIFKGYRVREKERLDKRKSKLDETALEVTIRRKFLDEWFTFFRTLSEPARQYAYTKLSKLGETLRGDMAQGRWNLHASKFIYQGKGAFYYSEFSRRRH